MSETVKIFKFFGAHEDEQQEAWLRSMAQQGLHLLKVNPFCYWTFRRGTPADIVYRVDFPNASRDPDFRQLVEDAGWSLAATTVGWHYWRTQAVNGKAPELFSDAASKARKFKERLGILVASSVPMLMSFVLFNMSRLLAELSWPFLVPYCAALAIYFLIAPYTMVKLAQRIRELNGSLTA